MIPPNTSAQERAIIDAIDFRIDPSRIRGFKFNPTDSVLPWLIYEYGLGEILAWVPDPRRAIKDGIRFQRIRGTGSSLRMALKWVNIEDIYIEEEPPGEHFAEFQVGIHDVANDFFVDNVVALAKLSAPARSRLMRMYNDRYDIRRFILDQSEFGSFLSDYSGVKLTPDGPILSFGRFNSLEAEIEDPNLEVSKCRVHHNSILSSDLYRLDFGLIGEIHSYNYNGIYIRAHIWQNDDCLSQSTEDLEPPLHFAKCLIVLSDSWNLGDINCCFPGLLENEIGGTFILSEDILSEQVWEIKYQEILERFASSYSSRANGEVSLEIESCVAKEHVILLSQDDLEAQDNLEAYQAIDCFKTASYSGCLVWHQHRHLNRPWSNKDPIISTQL